MNTLGRTKRVAARARKWGPLVVALVALALLVTPIMQQRTAEPASRYSLTASIWDHHTVVVDDEASMLKVDRALHAGHTYALAAPGQPVVGTLGYGAYRLLGGRRAPSGNGAHDAGLWATTLASSTIPALAVFLLMAIAGMRIDRRFGLAAAFALSTATLLLPFSTLLFGHVLAALCVFAGWRLIESHRHRWSLPTAGLLLGAAIAVEYQTALLAVAIGAVVVWRHRWTTWQLAGGAIGPLVALGAYHAEAFGSPFTPAYKFAASGRHSRGFFGLAVPNLHILLRSIAGDRGLIITPVVGMALVGAVLLVRREGWTARSWLGPLLVATLLLVQAGMDPYGGASPGPRFLIPALPFLVEPLVMAFQRFRVVSFVAAGIGISTMLTATITRPLVLGSSNGPQTWVLFARYGQLMESWGGHTGMALALLGGLTTAYAALRWTRRLSTSAEGALTPAVR